MRCGGTGGWNLTLSWGDTGGAFAMSSRTLLDNGSFQATLNGQPGRTYVIEASSDLLNWAPIGTNTLRGTTWDFVDSNAAASKFYRGVLRP